MASTALNFSEERLDQQLQKQKKACDEALCVLQKNGHKVAEFLRDQVTYKPRQKK